MGGVILEEGDGFGGGAGGLAELCTGFCALEEEGGAADVFELFAVVLEAFALEEIGFELDLPVPGLEEIGAVGIEENGADVFIQNLFGLAGGGGPGAFDFEEGLELPGLGEEALFDVCLEDVADLGGGIAGSDAFLEVGEFLEVFAGGGEKVFRAVGGGAFEAQEEVGEVELGGGAEIGIGKPGGVFFLPFAEFAGLADFACELRGAVGVGIGGCGGTAIA